MFTKPYGRMPDGRTAEAYTLTCGAMQAEILTYGAALNRLFVPDRDGNAENILLSFPSLEARLAGSDYQGETVGRYANRIADSSFSINGKRYQVTPNEDDITCLHGGGEFSHALWSALPCGDHSLVLRYTSPADTEGFPGEVETQVHYTLSETGLVIAYEAASTADTILNLTNHAYFNLAGQGDVLGHILQIDAAHYLPIDARSIPTGELRPVAGTAFDFRQPKSIGQDIRADDEQLRLTKGYDHNYCNPKTIAVYEPQSGRRMSVHSDLPGVQLYTGNFLPDMPGNPEGWSGQHAGFCLETQAWPDSPNQWPEQCLLRAGQVYRTETRFEFTIDS